MYKYILERAGDIEWMALGPLLLFFVFFIAITIMAMRKKSDYIEKMSQLPLDEN